jgi:FkbM family methyltransferase
MLLNLTELISKYSLLINGVIHIGAHFGEENSLYDEIGIQNRIYFEPLSSNFFTLEKNINGRFPVFKKALGNENKTVKMFVESYNNGQSSSILKPQKHLSQYPHIQFNAEEEVDMIRLDDFKFDFKEYNFINIDVQGYELEVFKGASNMLNKIDFIISEVNRDELYENCAKVDEIQSYLSAYGFEMVEVSWDGGTWGDALFIKKQI